MGRRYAGIALEQRTQLRRAALLASALENFGTAGYAATSVKQICLTAELTERYFYQSFADREDALAALYDDLSTAMREATVAAVAAVDGDDIDAVARAGLAAFIGYLTDDPRRARVVLIEVVGVSSTMERRRHDVLSDFAAVVSSVWAAGGHELGSRERSLAVALVGAVNHLLVDWLLGDRRQDVAELVDVCELLFAAAAEKVVR
ncbi:TetR/AcrR family transcriptional regulator [Gordonia shandongensis]|uniref:TetR/AcrR family transcriptional regulator n=1 Tax=Gordonia shandongensis TaxID=376351 RepID=UPI000408717C|nr:TetR/AcrR family transcriptional regulator [Gordonia shandongensis]